MATLSLQPLQHTVRHSLLQYARTAEQIAIDTGLSGNCVRPRLLELEELGLVRRSNARRRTLSGSTATVWEAVL
jgi:predicted ArsR family transcriptional regulator